MDQEMYKPGIVLADASFLHSALEGDQNKISPESVENPTALLLFHTETKTQNFAYIYLRGS